MWILSAILLLLIVFPVKGNFESDDDWGSPLSLLQETACEGYPIHMQCPGTDVVQVMKAMYGRLKRETCATNNVKNLSCQLPNAIAIASERCNNKTSCQLLVSSDNFPDPCPGTSKYLQVSYRCVKYMFGCPGRLVGIGSNITTETRLSPEAGSWTKDPISNPNHVFFASYSQQTLEEYENMEQFKNGGDSLQIYSLPSPMEGSSYVIFDRNVFYIEKRSRTVVKYSLKIRLRLIEGTLPGFYSPQNPPNLNKVHLAVDEKGLWAVYMGNPSSGQVAISLINKNTLAVQQTWMTSYMQSTSLHSFLICGVLYEVGLSSGEIDYIYNTNLPSERGKHVSIGFDQSRSIGSESRSRSPTSGRVRSFLSYNFSSFNYNPRDRLLYAWDAARSHAVSYNLHFTTDNPDQQDVSASSTTTTTTTSSPSTYTSKKHTAISSTPSDSKNVCLPTRRLGLEWPMTEVNNVAYAPCPESDTEFAHWLCSRDSTALLVKWDSRGPDLSECSPWYKIIKSNLNSGTPDVNLAADQLSHHASSIKKLDQQTVTEVGALMEEIAHKASLSPITLKTPQARQLVEDLALCEESVTRATSGWHSMENEDVFVNVDHILTSLEKVGYVLAGSIVDSVHPGNSLTESVIRSDVEVHIVVQDSSQFLSSPPKSKNQVLLSAEDSRNKEGISSLAIVNHKALAQLINDVLKLGPGHDGMIASDIVSVASNRSDQHMKLTAPITIRFLLTEEDNSIRTRRCVYWDFSSSSNTATWKSDGCRMTYFNNSVVECSCDHMTSFAVMVDPDEVVLDGVKIGLNALSIAGISISLLCLFLSFVTFICFRNLQCDLNSIHKHLCLTLFVAELVFIVGIDRTENQLTCAIISGVLHFMFLSAFVWMALEGFHLYITVVEKLEGKSRWVFYYLIGYGIPLVIVGVSAWVNSDGYGSREICWLKVDSGFIWSFVGPVCALVLSNLVFLAITITKLYRHKHRSSDLNKFDSLKTSVRGASILLCLLAITWAFGILWVWGETPIMAYLFCIFNAFQGLFIYIFHCLFPYKVRKEYRKAFESCLCCRETSHNSYLSNSMSFSKQYPPHQSSINRPQTHRQQPQLQGLLRHSDQSYPNSPQQVTLISNKGHADIGGSHITSSLGMEQSHRRSPQMRKLSHNEHKPLCPSLNPDGLINEDAYDHLERHCHTNECNYLHHAGMRPSAVEVPCSSGAPYGHAQTMSQLQSSRPPVVSENNFSFTSNYAPHKASTMSNVQGQDWNSHKMAVAVEAHSRAPHHLQNNDSYLTPLSRNSQRNHTDPQRIKTNKYPGDRWNRRSINSSGSEDPIVNDLSASSSAGSKPSSTTGTISGKPSNEVTIGSLAPYRHAPSETNIEGDENDLEVQRLTNSERCEEEKQERIDSFQRDSAFCQSAAELDSPFNRYSSPSSRCSARVPEPRMFQHHVRNPNINASSSDLINPHPIDSATGLGPHYVGYTRYLHGEGKPHPLSSQSIAPSHEYTNHIECNKDVDRRMTCL